MPKRRTVSTSPWARLNKSYGESTLASQYADELARNQRENERIEEFNEKLQRGYNIQVENAEKLLGSQNKQEVIEQQKQTEPVHSDEIEEQIESRKQDYQEITYDTSEFDNAFSLLTNPFDTISKIAQDNSDKNKPQRQESKVDRLNRRLWENNTFGKINKNKALTNKEEREIYDYRMISDPVFGNNQINQFLKASETLKDQTEGDIDLPDNYYNLNGLTFSGLITDPINTAKVIGRLATSAYAKSVLSNFIEKTNESQMEVSTGKITRADELLNLADKTRQYKDLLNTYALNLQKIQSYQNLINRANNAVGYSDSGKGIQNNPLDVLSNDQLQDFNNALDVNKELRAALEEGGLWRDANNLASWSSGGIAGWIGQKIDGLIDDDLGGIRGNLDGLGGKLDELNRLIQEKNHDAQWAERVANTSNQIESILKRFEQASAKKKEDWNKDYKVDQQDIIDWRKGNNWINDVREFASNGRSGFKTNIDDYYKQQEELLQEQNYTWKNPVQTAMFGWAGIAGGSNTSWTKSIISMASKGIGAIGGAMTTGGTSTLIQLGAIGASFEADKSSGSDENNIESANRISDSIRSQLNTTEKYDDFLKEGESQLRKNKANREILDTARDKNEKFRIIMDAFLNGEWHSEDPEITQMHADAIVGANNHFYNNQPVNTSDALIGSIVDITNLAPVRYLTNSAKIYGRFGRRMLNRTTAGSALVHGAEETGLFFKGIGRGLGTIGKESLQDAGKAIGAVAAKPIRWIGVEDKIARSAAKVREYATRIPSAWLNASTATKIGFNVVGRTAIDTASEMLQEGVQGWNAYNDPDNPIDYDVQHNRGMGLRILDDIALGAKSALYWVMQGDPAYYTDADVVGSMNATPLLTLFGPNLFQVGVQAHNLTREISINNFIANQIDMAKRGDRALVEQGEYYAKHLSSDDYQKMMERFDRYEKVAGTHRRANASVQAYDRLANGSTVMLQDDENAIPSELIEQQRNDYKRIYELGNSSEAKTLAWQAGIFKASRNSDGTISVRRKLTDFNTNKKYAQLVSLLNYRLKLEEEADAALNEVDNRLHQQFGLDINGAFELGEYDEDDVQQNSPANKLFLLARAKTLMDIIEDYEAIDKRGGKQNSVLARSKTQLRILKDRLKQLGLEVNSREDIVAKLSNGALSTVFRGMLSQINPEAENWTGEEMLEAMSQEMREREMKAYDAQIAGELKSDFMKFPEKHLEKYQEAKKSDARLQAIIEADYIEGIRRLEDAANREVRDMDVYVGSDGLYYITDKRRDKNGRERIVKHRYHVQRKEIDDEDLPFDPVEYNEALTAREQALENRRKNREANERVRTGKVQAKPATAQQPATTEPATEEPETEEPQYVSEYSTGDNVYVKDSTGKILPATIVDEEEQKQQGWHVVVDVNGVTRSVHDSQLNKQDSAWIDGSQYSIGQKVQKDGKKNSIIGKRIIDIDQSTNEAVYEYTIQDDEGNVEYVTDSDIAAYVEPQPSNKVEPNAKQREVMDILKQKREDDKKLVKRDDKGDSYTTSHNYFIKVKNKFLQFVRVHGVLDNLFEDTDEQKKAKKDIIDRLKDKKGKELADEILKIQDEYNQKLADEYGKDSFAYEKYHIDLKEYTKQQNLSDPNTISAVAEVASGTVLGPAVVAGSIIDEIARLFFSSEERTVAFDEKYKMSKETFNDLIEQLKETDKRFVKLGWVVDTTPYTWYGNLGNGTRVAGETDMIAIDQQGNIHVLDFKTTRSSKRFGLYLDPESGKQKSHFIHDVAKLDGKEGKRSYAAQYAMQLEAYRLLIQQQTGKKVTSLEVIPFYLEYEDNGPEVTEITGTLVYDPINLSAQPELQPYINDVDNYLTSPQTEPISDEEIDDNISELQELIQKLNELIGAEGVLSSTNDTMKAIIDQIRDVIASYSDIKKSAYQRTDATLLDNLSRKYDSLARKVNTAIDKARQDIEDNKPQGEPVVVQNDDWRNSPEEPVVPSESNRWWHFNNLHSFTDIIRHIPKYMASIIKDDFITNSTFEIIRPSLPRIAGISEEDWKKLEATNDKFEVRITYHPAGQKAITFNKTIYLQLGKNNDCPTDLRNQQSVADRYYSTMAMNFIRQYNSLLSSLKPGEIIVAKNVKRTNGKLIYSANKEYKLKDTAFFPQDDPNLTHILNGEDSLVGVVDEDGRLFEVQTGDRNTIDTGANDLDGNSRIKHIEEKPGNYQQEGIPAGSVVFIHKFRYNEDPEGEMRRVPLVLKGRRLTKTDINFIWNVISNPRSMNNLVTMRETMNDGTTRETTIPGFTNKKALALLVRFGEQASHAGHEFVFQYANKELEDGTTVKDTSKILITDMRKEAVLDEETGLLHRDIITLDLEKDDVLKELQEILSLVDMHINQVGIMSALMNDEEDGAFGNIRGFFESENHKETKSVAFNKNMSFSREDVFPNKDDHREKTSGIAWMIKNGHATTNAVRIENPLISITELEKINPNEQKAEEKSQELKKEEPQTVSVAPEAAVPEEQNPTVEPEPEAAEKKKVVFSDADLDAIFDNDDSEELPGAMGGGRLVVERLRETPISEKEQKKIIKRIKRLVGNVGVTWHDNAVEVLASGAQVAGRTARLGFELSRRLTEGTEFHEIFHRILEILTTDKRRKKIYEEYKRVYGERFEKANGRPLSERDISEGLAEMFREFMTSRERVKLHWDITRTLREIGDYIQGLRKLDSRKFAMFFMIANSGIYRFAKPNKENLEHFMTVLGGMSDLTISAKVNGENRQVNLSTFPDFGGRELFDDAIEGIKYTLVTGYSIDKVASNAAALSTRRSDIVNLNKKKGESETSHSAWFRILTGEYIKDGQISVYDAMTYEQIFRQSDDVRRIKRELLEKFNGDIQSPEFKKAIIQEIANFMANQTEDSISQSQRMWGELLSEENWPIIEQKVNQKLRKISIDSEYNKEEIEREKRDNDDGRPTTTEDGIGEDVHQHDDAAFYDHSRTEDATAAIRFFLSTIPDEHFATEEDVANGYAKATKDKNGNPIMVPNYFNLLGFKHFLSMKVVSNKLLLACKECKTAKQLNELLQSLMHTDPILYRIAKTYNAYYNDQIKKHKSGKNRISIRGEEIAENKYIQHEDENGVYYTWVDSEGEDTNKRIEEAVTMVNTAKEAFVTQLFNYVSCQRLDFIQVVLSEMLDEEGEVIDNKHTAKIQSSDSDYASTILPRQWFALFRNGLNGIFRVSKSGEIKLTDYGEKQISQASDTLKAIYDHFTRAKSKYAKGNRQLDRLNEDDFREIENDFVQALNTFGINISVEALNFWLREDFSGDSTGLTTQQLFSRMLTRADQTLSFKAFRDDLYAMSQKLSKSGKNDILTISQRKEKRVVRGRSVEQKASGINIYSDSAFVKWLAKGVSRYNKYQYDLNTNGPEGTRRYTLAQSHTASDITDDLNTTVIESNGRVPKGRIVKDMMRYGYCWSVRNGKQIGSIIIKHFTDAEGVSGKIKLYTHGGVRLNTDHTGGVAYNKITQREDWIAKAAILQKGYIIFPTLSDKSTWFYLGGVKVPGLNYNNLSAIAPASLLQFGILNDQNPDSNEVHVKLNWNNPNAQLDQMIEYAFCERNQIEKEIKRTGLTSKIKFWDENRKRFGGLTEVARMVNGKLQYEYLNDYSKSPEDCLALADQVFFGDHITDAQRREMMALTLEQGFLENLAVLERSGLISVTGGDSHRMFRYHNIGLDSDVIDELTRKFLPEKKKNENLTAEEWQLAESQAITAYVWDIYMRGQISNEETERAFTGAPMFYKWIHGITKDVVSGKDIDVLLDRYSDQSKRLGGLGSTGEHNRTDMVDIRRTYKCAEVGDWMVQSKLYEYVRDSMIDNEVRGVYYDIKRKELEQQYEDDKEGLQTALDELSDTVYGDSKLKLEEIEKQLSYTEEQYKEAGNGINDVETDAQRELKYRKSALEAAKAIGKKQADPLYIDEKTGEGKINVADGAAYITPKMAKNLLRMRGRFTPEVEKAFAYLEGIKDEDGKRVKNPLRDADAYRVIHQALLGAQKYSAYGYRKLDPSKNGADSGDVMVHYYDKFALFPIFPQLATGFTRDLLKKMEEDGVDMLMMASAVKTGSESPSELTPDSFNTKEDFDKFHFNTYEQDYAFIRRQLNTDPNETRDNNMGTQMTKVALSSLDPNRSYKTKDGKVVRGRTILDNIMNSIKELSDIGKKEIREEFFTNGKLDIDKFSQFLIRELESRDADENLIDGVQIEEVEDKDGNIVKQLKLPLEAMSSVEWIQSIIVSTINKAVIDISVDGNAFYQRSVWGMEGHPHVLSEDDIDFGFNTINGGKDIKLVNNDGSMDAVVSIDYYDDLFKKIDPNNKMSFAKRRQWLIDHNIIGNSSEVHADTIASRIPTQAQSSIHALRFVDVLPVVRDTIVLPREFTAITGSDFDIDKLYLARFSYGIKTTKVDGKLVDTVTTKFENGRKKYQNELLENYMTILKDHGTTDENGNVIGNSTNISLRSIDKDTQLVKDVQKIVKGSEPQKRYYAYQFGNIAFQVKTKAMFMIGKFGIGPFALNNNSQILTQLYGVKFAKDPDSILTILGCTDLSQRKDKENNSILSWLSGLINIHVDVAKDPDPITDLNINQFTYNLVNLLIRTGMGSRSLLFTSQPIMKELARVYEDASGQYLTDQDKSKSARQKKAIKDFLIDNFKESSRNKMINNINFMMMEDGTEQENRETEYLLGQYARAFFGLDKNGNYIEGKSILEDIITNPEARIHPDRHATFDNMRNDEAIYSIKITQYDGTVEELSMTPKQVQLYVAFINNAFDKYGKKLSDLVNACKIDTKKHGKSYVEQQAYLSKYNTVFNNEDWVFEQQGLDDLKKNSFIGKKTENATDLYKEILGEFSLQATDPFVRIHDRILKRLNSSVENAQLSKKVQRGIMKYLKTRFFNSRIAMYTEANGVNYWDYLFYGEDSVQSHLIQIQNKLLRDKNGQFGDYAKAGVITNPLLKALQIDIYEERDGFNNPKLITLENALLDDSDNANSLERAWDQLYKDEEHYIEDKDGNHITFKQFAIDLALYAFYTSGDNTGGTKFFKYVPNTIRREIGYANYIRGLGEYLAGNPDEIDEEIIEGVIGQNWADKDMVKMYRPTKKIGKNRVPTFKVGGNVSRSISTVKRTKKGFIRTHTDKIINTIIGAVSEFKNKGLKATIHPTNDLDKYPPYIRVRRPTVDRFDPDNMLLYKFVGTAYVNPQNHKEGEYPIYVLELPTAANYRAGSYFYDIIMAPGCTQVSYDTKLLDKYNEVFGNKDYVFVEGKIKGDTEKQRKQNLLDAFVESVKELGVFFGEDYMAERIAHEFAVHEIDISEKQLSKAVEFVIGQLNNPNKVKETKESAPKREVRKVVTTTKKEDKEEKEEKPKTKPKKEENENKTPINLKTDRTLNNVGYRPFQRDGIEFSSVYQANYYDLIDYLDISEQQKEEARERVLNVKIDENNTGTAEIKSILQEFGFDPKDEQMQTAYLTSLEQNVEASFRDPRNTQILLDTGNKEFTGNEVLESILDELRTRLRDEQRDSSREEEEGEQIKNKCKGK